MGIAHIVHWRTVLKISTFIVLRWYCFKVTLKMSYTCWKNIEFLLCDVLLGSPLEEWMKGNRLCGCESYWSGSKSYVVIVQSPGFVTRVSLSVTDSCVSYVLNCRVYKLVLSYISHPLTVRNSILSSGCIFIIIL